MYNFQSYFSKLACGRPQNGFAPAVTAPRRTLYQKKVHQISSLYPKRYSKKSTISQEHPRKSRPGYVPVQAISLDFIQVSRALIVSKIEYVTLSSIISQMIQHTSCYGEFDYVSRAFGQQLAFSLILAYHTPVLFNYVIELNFGTFFGLSGAVTV